MKNLLEGLKKIRWEFPVLVLLGLTGFVLIHDIAGGTLFDHNVYDSYTIQAMAWLRGEAHLAGGEAYTWLEIAEYGGKYYLSFPPVPTLTMLPLVLIFGSNTPSNLVVIVYTMLALWGAYRLCRERMEEGDACFWAAFAVLASNMVEISSTGGVWLQAQTLNMALCMWGMYCLISGRRSLSLGLFALAVGCRPFSAVYLVFAAVYILFEDRSIKRSIKSSLPGIAAVCAVAAALMWYNYIRFDNPLEFGHNYLPEHINALHGQFHISYLGQNLRYILRPVLIRADGSLDYPIFEGFMFFVANPLFLVWMISLARDTVKRRLSPQSAACSACLILNLLALCMHKGFGGYQFGARYTLDLIPYGLMYLVLSGKKSPALWEKALCAFGLMFNAYGTVIMRLKLRG